MNEQHTEQPRPLWASCVADPTHLNHAGPCPPKLYRLEVSGVVYTLNGAMLTARKRSEMRLVVVKPSSKRYARIRRMIRLTFNA